MRFEERHLAFAAFTAVFAVLAAMVFWGCWSTGITFISPDDGVAFPLSYSDVLTGWWNKFITSGKMQPSDIFFSGLFFSPHVCRELKYAFALYCAGLGLAYFLRGRGLSHLASYGAGLLLSFCGYWSTLFSAGHAGWFVWMTYGTFVFGLVDRALERGAWGYWLWTGVLVAWASYQQSDLWLLFTVFTGLYFSFRLISLKVFPWKKMLAAGVVCALVGAPSFYSAFVNDLSGRDKQIEESKGTSLGGNSKDDAEARWIFTTNWSMPPEDTLEFCYPRVHGDTSCPFTLSINAKKGVKPYTGALGRPKDAKEGNYRQHSLYVGWATCLLALVGVGSLLVRTRGVRVGTDDAPLRPVIAFFAIAAVVFWLFSLGRYCAPVYRLVYALPFGDYLRAPVKWHHLTEFCLCVLAGFGINFVEQKFKHLKHPHFLLPPSSIILILFILVGAIDLARIDHLYCAPVDYSRAIAAKCSSQLTVLSREQFKNPQIAEMVRRGELISVANWLGNPNAYLVQYLTPQKPAKPASPKPLPLTLGIISVLTVPVAAAISLRKRCLNMV